MAKNYTKFFQFLEDLKSYFIKFDLEKKINVKNYLLKYKIRGEKLVNNYSYYI